MFILQLGNYCKLWWSSESSQISEPTISASLLSGRKFIRHLEAFLGSKFVIGSDLIHSYQAEGSTIDSFCYSGLLACLDMLLKLNGCSSFNYVDYTLMSVLWEETLDSWWLMKDLLEGLEEECSNKPRFESSSSSREFNPTQSSSLSSSLSDKSFISRLRLFAPLRLETPVLYMLQTLKKFDIACLSLFWYLTSPHFVPLKNRK